MKLRRGLLVLDVGCGGGEFHVNPRGTVNVDIAIPKKKVENFILCDAHYLPFLSSCFDKVVMFDVLEHLYSPLNVLREVWRVLKYNGRLVIGTPNACYITRTLRVMLKGCYIPHHDHIAVWGIPELSSLLFKTGFREHKIEPYTYIDSRHNLFVKILLKLCPFPQLKHRQLYVRAQKK